MSARIVKFSAENFKRLRAVEITPDGNTVVISGRNAQGKTSVLDAIWCAVGGRAANRDVPRPVRDGEDSATVSLDLGDIIVTRDWKADGKSTLSVTSAEGAKFPSPQKMLDELVGVLSFDPTAFIAMSPRDQLATLVDLVELDFDPESLAMERQVAFDKRTDANREVKRLAAVLDGTPRPAEVPEEVSVAELMAELAEARETEAMRTELQQAMQDVVDVVDREQAKLDDLEARVAEQQDVLAAAKATAQGRIAEVTKAISELPATDIDGIETVIATADETNTLVRQAAEHDRIAADHEAAVKIADELTAAIEACDARRRDGLASATMPIDGLSLDDDGVTYQGVPLGQASAAEQLRVSMAIAMAANPALRVIRITDGSLLDSTNLALIESMAADADYQVWIEVVDETGDLGVMIEDGAVAS